MKFDTFTSHLFTQAELVSQCHATSHGAFAQLVELATVLLGAASFSITALSFPPTRTTIIDSHIQVINPIPLTIDPQQVMG